MTLRLPDLDDRTFTQLVDDARQRIINTCPQWTDLSVHDPGMALIEVFAYLTEVMLYRLNRVPEKAYIAFLNLIGVRLQPPAAASVVLEFSRARPDGGEIVIPARTRVSVVGAAGGEAPVFATGERAVIEPGREAVQVTAHHCDVIDGELVGAGSGLPGVALEVSRPPIAVTSEPVDVLVGVEVRPGELAEGAIAREFAGKTFELWREEPAFAGFDQNDKVYVLDRATGKLSFAPAVTGVYATRDPVPLAAVPPSGREIRVWYRTGGGPTGNVAANTLTSLKDAVAGVKVTNPQPAQGGRGIESLDNAVLRGPQEFFSLRRAVTATDFERLAVAGSGAVARAKALTRSEVWSFARPGVVEVILVPYVPDEARPGGRLTIDALLAHEVEDVRAGAQVDLDNRRPLGVSCITAWARYKPVSIAASVVVRREEDAEAVRRRVLDRLYQTISPLPTVLNPGGWPFGEALRASNVFRMLEQSEPGVRYVDRVRFRVDEAPDGAVRAIAADQYQASTWYTASGPLLFRSTNDGQGWEPAGRFPDEEVRVVAPYPGQARPGIEPRPGHVAVVARRLDGSGSSVHVSTDLGERWQEVARLDAGVADVAWLDRAQVPILLLATDVGLYELPLLPDATPLPVLVEPEELDRGFYKVATFTNEFGQPGVALAAQAQYGIYLSTQGGQAGTFSNIGLQGVDTRTLSVQFDGPATYLWAGAGEADPNRPGSGVSRARLYEADVRWTSLSQSWGGGTCWSLAFSGSLVFAGTQSGGVLSLDLSAPQQAWRAPDVNCGLPLRDQPRFEAANAVATDPGGTLLIVGGPKGVYRSRDGGVRYQATANRESTDVVTVPETWILASGTHEIEVVTGDAARRD